VISGQPAGNYEKVVMRNFNQYIKWTHCPNCDASLPRPVGLGEDWDCGDCGERGTYERCQPSSGFEALSGLILEGPPSAAPAASEDLPF